MNHWIVRPRPSSAAALRLFCVPSAGGDSWLFQEWGGHLPGEVEVCLVRLPGRGSRITEQPFTRLRPLVSALAEALQGYLEIPFALFGHSMGGLVVFELARYLRRHSHVSPTHLFVAACRAPQLPRLDSPIHHLPDSLFAAELARRYGPGRNILQNRELMRLVLPMVRADFSLCETYVYMAEAPLDCPISVFGGTRDQMIDLLSLEAWRLQTCASFSLRLLAGNHFFVTSSRLALLRALSEDLGRFLAKRAHRDTPNRH
jgi:medium-chain acyl-[acyl-carrier-protein] hydrolase